MILAIDKDMTDATKNREFKMEINCNSNKLFDSTGLAIIDIERDGDTVIYKKDGNEHIGTIGQDVFTIHQLTDFVAALKALKIAEGDTPYTPKYSIRVNNRNFTYLAGHLTTCFYKQNGYVLHYAPVTVEEAQKLTSTRYYIVYIKNSDKFRIKDKLAKNW